MVVKRTNTQCRTPSQNVHTPNSAVLINIVKEKRQASDIDDQKQVKTVCTRCSREFFMRDLRKHIESCASAMLQASMSEISDKHPYFPELYDTSTTVQIEESVPTVFMNFTT